MSDGVGQVGRWSPRSADDLRHEATGVLPFSVALLLPWMVVNAREPNLMLILLAGFLALNMLTYRAESRNPTLSMLSALRGTLNPVAMALFGMGCPAATPLWLMSAPIAWGTAGSDVPMTTRWTATSLLTGATLWAMVLGGASWLHAVGGAMVTLGAGAMATSLLLRDRLTVAEMDAVWTTEAQLRRGPTLVADREQRIDTPLPERQTRTGAASKTPVAENRSDEEPAS